MLHKYLQPIFKFLLFHYSR